MINIYRKNFRLSRIFLVVLQLCVLCFFPFMKANGQEAKPDIRELVVGETIVRAILGQEIHIYAVQLKLGQVLRVTIQEKGADVATVAVKVEGEQKASAASNSGSGFTQESTTLIPDKDGVYAIVVRAEKMNEANKEAKYELLTSLSGSVTKNDTQRVQAEKLFEEAAPLLESNDKSILLNAISKYESSILIWRNLGDWYWEGIAKIGIGGSYLKSQDFAKAEIALNEAFKIFEAKQRDSEIGMISINLATLYALTKNEEKTRIYAEKALAIIKKLGDKRGESIANVIFSGLSLKPNASLNFEQELSKLRAKQDKKGELELWARQIFSYLNEKNDESEDDEVDNTFFLRAEKEALPLAKLQSNKESEIKILTGLGIVFAGADEDDKTSQAKSQNYLMQGLLLSKSNNNTLFQAICYMGFSFFYDDKNDKIAIFFAKRSINLIQEMKKEFKVGGKEAQQDFARQVEEVYAELAFNLMFENRLIEAHQVINFSRDQEFFDIKIFTNENFSKLTLTERETENDQFLTNFIETISAKYTNLTTQLVINELKTFFVKIEKNFKTVSTEKDIARNITDTQEMQSSLFELNSKTGKRHAVIYVMPDGGEILLITPDKIKAFGMRDVLEESRAYSENFYKALVKQVQTGVITKEEAIKKGEEFKLESQKNFDKLLTDRPKDISDFLEVLRSPKIDPRPLASAHYKEIFKKSSIGKTDKTTLEAELSQYKPDVLFWSLAGDLRYVPVAALYDAEKKQYLVEKYQNVVFTRAKKERFLIEPKQWKMGVGFGTSIGYDEFEALPGVIKETSAIFGNPATNQKGYFEGQVFLNNSFNLQTLLDIKRIRPNFVHIASHFNFKPGDSANSFLLLGDGKRLSLFDLQRNYDLFLGVDLLALSACETATQQADANGKEVDAFVELAQRLGASSVVASLWKVSDEGTAKLMTEFYRLKKNNPQLSKALALQQAQLSLLKGGNYVENDITKKTTRGSEIIESKSSKDRIPFTPSINAPFEHPFYWSPFVLYGSSR